MRTSAIGRWGLTVLLFSPAALADEPDAGAPAPSGPLDTAVENSDAKPEATGTSDEPPVRPANDPRREEDLTPHPSRPPTMRKNMFVVDPVADGGVLAFGGGFALLSTALLDTGEIRPQQISPRFSSRQLLWIDRGAIWQAIDGNAHTYSNIALGTLAAYALFDTVLDGVREGATASLVDAALYAESVTITLGVTNLAKIAFRRPRPRAYIERSDFIASGGDYTTYENSVTDSALSFFSGHTAVAASLASTATYISFLRSPQTARPWLTLAGGTLLTAFVGYERVRSGAHFPTDVLAGALAGSAIGALVVHLHRADSVHERRVWIGGGPSPGGGTVSATGTF